MSGPAAWVPHFVPPPVNGVPSRLWNRAAARSARAAGPGPGPPAAGHAHRRPDRPRPPRTPTARDLLAERAARRAGAALVDPPGWVLTTLGRPPDDLHPRGRQPSPIHEHEPAKLGSTAAPQPGIQRAPEGLRGLAMCVSGLIGVSAPDTIFPLVRCQNGVRSSAASRRPRPTPLDPPGGRGRRRNRLRDEGVDPFDSSRCLRR